MRNDNWRSLFREFRVAAAPARHAIAVSREEHAGPALRAVRPFARDPVAVDLVELPLEAGRAFLFLRLGHHFASFFLPSGFVSAFGASAFGAGAAGFSAFSALGVGAGFSGFGAATFLTSGSISLLRTRMSFVALSSFARKARSASRVGVGSALWIALNVTSTRFKSGFSFLWRTSSCIGYRSMRRKTSRALD